MEVYQRMERYRRAHQTQSYISREAMREAVRLYMMEPEVKRMFQGWVYEVLLRDEATNS